MATRIKELSEATALESNDCFAIDNASGTKHITADTLTQFFNKPNLFKNYDLTWLIGSELYLQIGPLELESNGSTGDNKYRVVKKLADKERNNKVGWLKCNNKIPIELDQPLSQFDQIMLVFADEAGSNLDSDTQMSYFIFDVELYKFVYRQQTKRNDLFALGNKLKNDKQTIETADGTQYEVTWQGTAYATHNYGDYIYLPNNYAWANNGGSVPHIVQFYKNNDHMKSFAFGPNNISYLVAAIGMKFKQAIVQV